MRSIKPVLSAATRLCALVVVEFKLMDVAALVRVAGPPQAPPAGHQDILNYLVAGGRPALQEMAAATGMTESAFLDRVFGMTGQAPNPAAAVLPQPRFPQRPPGLGMGYGI